MLLLCVYDVCFVVLCDVWLVEMYCFGVVVLLFKYGVLSVVKNIVFGVFEDDLGVGVELLLDEFIEGVFGVDCIVVVEVL